MREAAAELLHEVSPDVRTSVLSGLQAFNAARTGSPPPQGLAVVVRRPDGEVEGGLIGRTGHGWLAIELFFLPEALRGSGLGRRILAEAEAEAIRRGCHSARVETGSFQAPDFYRKAGYRVFGTLERYPGQHESYYLRKDLGPAEPA